MAAFRLLDQNPVQFSDEVTAAASGYYLFSETGTSTPKNVYSTAALSVSLGSQVDLDASGRPTSDIWLDGEYRVRLMDADDAQIWLRDNVRDVATGGIAVLDPADGNEDDVYSTDGAAASWRAISEVPSQTGHADKVLKTDGTVATWQAEQTIPTYTTTSLPGGITQGATSFQVGKFLVQTGTGSAPTAAAESTTSTAVTFGTAYATLLHIDVSPTGTGGFTGRGAGVDKQINGSTTGFTARFYAGAEHGSNDYNITSTVNFTWVAFGLVA